MGEMFGISILPGVRSLEETRQMPRLRHRYAFHVEGYFRRPPCPVRHLRAGDFYMLVIVVSVVRAASVGGIVYSYKRRLPLL